MNKGKTDIRQIVKMRIATLGWSNYKLAEACKGDIPVSTLYEFLAGKGNLSSQQLGVVLDQIGMGLHADEDHAQGMHAILPKKRK